MLHQCSILSDYIPKEPLELDPKWLNLIERVDYAFQPIVDIENGKTFGFEALIRGYESKTFTTIDSVFDTAYNENVLHKLDMILREKAIKKFAKLDFSKKIKLFYNLDNRITSMPDFASGETLDVMKMFDLDKTNICFELSEKHQAGAYVGVDALVLNTYKKQGYSMAIDDFGVGYSGLQMLYRSEPDFIKIDKYFISEIDKNKNKQIFVSAIIEMSQAMGICIIAEGVERAKELEECKRLGCCMVQGYLVAKPTRNLLKLRRQYDNILELSLKNRRDRKNIQNIDRYIEVLPALHENSNLDDVFKYFRENPTISIIPIVSDDFTPIGIIKEVDLKQYIFSQFGYSILKKHTKNSIKKFTIVCGIAKITDSLERMLKIYSHNSDNGGIIITKNTKYSGFLSTKVILDLINAKRLLDAKEQNPLTGLNGNKIINTYIAGRLKSKKKCVIVYFDFDNFKPFNDYYGFRKGDRAILLFADILKKKSILKDSLVGHVGGDDFFLGWNNSNGTDEDVYQKVKKIVNKFAHDVESFYDDKDRARGFIKAKNREGIKSRYNLLTVSAAVLLVKDNVQSKEDIVVHELAKLKKSAKMISGNVAWATLLE